MGHPQMRGSVVQYQAPLKLTGGKALNPMLHVCESVSECGK